MSSKDPARLLARLPKRDFVRVKLLSVGDGAVGKSCLIKRYCEERFVAKYIPTIGVDYGVKSIQSGGQEVRVNFWDLSGRPEYFEIRNEFYKDTQGAFFVFDSNKRPTFSALEQWLEEASKFGLTDTSVVAIVANKSDLKKRAVPEDEARAWAASKGYLYFETSANSGEGVHELFEGMLGAIMKKR